MKRCALMLLLGLGLAVAPALADDVLLLGFSGFDYQDPDPVPGTFLAVGEGYKTLGFVTEFKTPIVEHVNPAVNEYTYFYYDLTVVSNDFTDGVLMVTFADPGRGRFYEDPKSGGTPALYGVNPPNATAPSSFVDGSVILGGQITGMFFWYDYVMNQGGFSANMSFDEGTLITYIPPNQRNGWTLAGLTGRPNPSVPDGYQHQISGECRIPGSVSAKSTTWGAIKALYR